MSALAIAGRRQGRRRARGGGLLGTVALGILVVLTLIAVFAPLLAPQDPNTVDLSAALQEPSAQHLLGTDASGRDLLSRLIMGSRTSLLGPLLVVVGATLAGTALAVSAAWIGGWYDAVVARVVDITFAFPGLLLAILAVALFGAGLAAPVIALAISYTPYIARNVRAAALRERSLPYVEACGAQGLSGAAICVRHLLPNLLPFVLAQSTLAFGYAMVDMAAMSYLGFGVQPPTSDWGLMVSTGQQGILNGAPWEALFAGGLIVISVASFNLVSDRIERRARG